MPICSHCKKKHVYIPFHCRRCGKNHCPKCRLPENHACRGPRGGTVFTNFGSRRDDCNVETTGQISQINKKYSLIIRLLKRFTWWLNDRSRRQRINYGDFFMNLFWIAILSLSLMIIYSNLSKLNEIFLWFLPLGGTLLSVNSFFWIRYFLKLLKKICRWYNGERNWIKHLVVILLMLLLWQGYQNRSGLFDNLIEKYGDLNLEEVFPIEKESVKLPLRNETKIEMKIFELTNMERVKVGKPPLRWNSYLAQIAKSHSRDMTENNYFEHNKVNLGENIGEVPISWIPFYIIVEGCILTLTNNQIASCHMDGWVNSPGHYSNMISSSYSEIGVGVACNFFECKATQNFS